MYPTSLDAVKAIHEDRLREVGRIHRLAAAANARPKSRMGLAERIGALFSGRTTGRAHPATK